MASRVACLLLALLAPACRVDSRDDPGPATGSPPRVTIGQVSWYVDYGAALEVAREEDKALWVHFGENPG